MGQSCAGSRDTFSRNLPLRLAVCAEVPFAEMSDIAGPVARALIAYFDALARLKNLTAIEPGAPSAGGFPSIHTTGSSRIVAHEAIHALRHFLDVARDEPILTQHYQIALTDLIARHGDPDSAT